MSSQELSMDELDRVNGGSATTEQLRTAGLNFLCMLPVVGAVASVVRTYENGQRIASGQLPV
jgi:hypothetical protein